MSDSFKNNPNVTKWPTEVGHYWFYGYRYGKISCGAECEKEIMLCEASKMANGLAVIGDMQFIYENEVEEALFIPATLPEIP